MSLTKWIIPPLAPNCTMVQEYSENGGIYLLYENKQHGCKFNFGDGSDTRKIIAALERSAWLDEHRRRNQEFSQRAFGPKEGIGRDMQLMAEGVEQALDFAASWATWGSE